MLRYVYKKINSYNDYLMSRTRIICLLILMNFNLLDDISTHLGMSVGAIETNIITKNFYVFGNIGFLFTIIYELILFITGFLVIEFGFFVFERLTLEEIKTKYKIFVYFVFTTIVSYGIFMAIINNIRVFMLMR